MQVRLTSVLAVLAGCLLILVPGAAHAAAGDGFVDTYDVGIIINSDGSLDVSERIDYTFTDRSHGIYRNIPNRYPVTEPFTPESSDTTIDKTYDRVIDIEDIEVTSSTGAPTDLDISQQGNQHPQ